ncbi:MAG: A24 family peptidase [Alphaproteobacteria bacterium]
MPIEFHHLPIVFFIALLAWAAVSDLRRYVIPNRVCLAAVALYPAYVMMVPTAVDWPGAALVAGASLAVGFVAFALRLMGGGDAKLFAAGALWAGPELAIPFVFVTALAGGALALITITPWRALFPAAMMTLGAEAHVIRRAEIPYGVAIATGGLFVAWRLLLATAA